MNDSLSVTQHYIQLDEELHPGTAKYNVGVYYKIYGTLDIPRLCQSITAVVSSHDIFTSKAEVRVVDASDKSPAEIIEWIEEDNRVPFQFDTGPLYTFFVFTFGQDLCIWYMKCHHILMDGWSFKLFFNQVAVAYDSLTQDKPVEHIEGTYRAFVEEQNEYRQKPQYEKDLEFWKEYFKDRDANSLFASNKEDSEVAGDSVEIGFTPVMVKELEAIALEQGVSLSQLFMASFSIILHKFYQKSSMTFGVPIMNRKKKYESVVGLFINLVPVRFELEKEATLADFLKTVKSEFLKVLRHQRFQHAEIMSTLDLARDKKRLYDVRFSFEPFDFAQSFAGHAYDMQPLSNHDEEEPISIHVRYYHEGDVRICCDYNAHFVCKDEVLSIMDAWKYLIGEFRGLLHGSIDQIFAHYTAMQNQVLTFGRHYEQVLLPQYDYISCWQKAAHSYADKVCITFQGQEYTYQEIEDLANSYAKLYKSHKIDKANTVIILLERSEKCVAAILAAMKIQATYIPLDINCPPDRIAAIYADCGCKAIVTTTKYASQVVGRDCIILENAKLASDQYITQAHDPEAIAYIIYTSGSTGKPKGVPIRNVSMMDYVQGFIDYFRVVSSDVVLQQASIAFDASVEEIFPVLAVGGTLSITEDNRDFAKILDDLQSQKFTILSTNPYVVNYINEHADLSCLALRVLISGGAVLQPEDISSLVGKVPLYNTYGPTESTVCATYYPVTDHKPIIPIGKPCENRSVYVLDSSYRLLPTYAVGEICIGGLGLSPGYINNAAENDKRFIPHPFKANERIYKTGDLAKWNALGQIEYIGRNDEQIKLHGNRIELGEIEKVLRQFEEIQNAVVKVRNGSIAAFCETRHNNFDKAAIHKQLKTRLPPYMLPVYYIHVTHIPLTDNGKLDERSLPAISSDDLVRQEYRPAVTALQCSLVDLWKAFVGVEVIGLDDNFLEIGGHSLQMLHMRNQIQQRYGAFLSLSELNEHLTIEKLASLIESKLQSSCPEVPMELIPQSSSYDISPTQRRLWILSQTLEAARAYHICGSYQLHGKVDVEAFRHALQRLADRHESLRTTFTEIQGQITQSIQPVAIDFEVVDLDGDTVKVIQDFYAKSFDLSKGPLWRMAIFRVENAYILSASFHHIICDGWSVEILLRELSEAYAGKTWPALSCQYKDYVYWQQKYVLSDAYLQDKEYWNQVFASDVAKLNLPYDFARPAQKSYRGACVEHRFMQIDTIKAFAAQNQATLFMVLTAGLRALLYRYTGQSDFVLGTVVAGRDHSSLIDQVGVYVNTLLLRAEVKGSNGFRDLLASERMRELDAFTHQRYPYDHLVEDLQVNDLLEVLVILHNQKSLLQGGGLQLPGVEASGYNEAEASFSQFGLTFAFFEEGASSLVLKLEYDTDLFCQSTILRLIGHYERLLNALVQDPEYPISDIQYLDDDETCLILDKFSGKDRPYIDYGTTSVIDWIESQTPSAIALIVDGTEYSYRDVTALSNQLAHFLIGKGASLVGIKLPRNAWLPIGALSVLKAGMAYVPLDEAYPEERLAYIQSDSACDMILDMAMIERFLQEQALYPTSAPNIQLLPDTLAYVIYTSGSTGNPKGVCITHSNVTAFVGWCQQEFKNDCFDVVYGVTSHCFDLSIFEIFFTWSIGKTLKLLANGLVVPESLASDKNVLLNTVPSLVQNLLATKVDLSPITVLNMAGEEILMSLKQQLDCQKMAVRNLYGPTEDTTYSTFYRLSNEDAYIPIGRPISNSTAYVLDGAMQIVPVGIAGEIYLGGSGLARGYLGKEALTLEKFVENPYETGTRLYRTGDLGAWAPNGQLLFKGRKDYQVKVRGFRIELGEIEKALEKHVSASAVLLKEESLVAYVSGCLNTKELREKLHKSLPGYMVPEHIIELPSLPLTPNGKIDRQCLKKLPLEIAPRNQSIPLEGLEGQIWKLWSELLGHSHFGVDDSFFDVGGNSLKALKMVYELNRSLHLEISFAQFYHHNTIKALIDNVATKEHEGLGHAPILEYYDSSPVQERLWLLSQNAERARAYHVCGSYMLEGELDIFRLDQALTLLTKRHESLRTTFVEFEGKVCQKIHVVEQAPLEILDVERSAFAETVHSIYNQPFELTSWPLWRIVILRIDNTHHLFCSVFHHLISDGWSIEVLMRELKEVYDKKVLPNLEYQYKDYVYWQQRYLVSDAYLQDKAYWTNSFASDVAKLNLPYDFARPAQKSYRGACVEHRFLQIETIKAYAAQNQATLFMVLTAGLRALLYRYTGQTDFVLGTVVAGRDHSSLVDQVGVYVNTLLLRGSVIGTNGFNDLVASERVRELDAFTHQRYPYDHLVEELQVNDLLEVMIILHNQASGTGLELSNTQASGYKDAEAGFSQFDVTFSFFEEGASNLVLKLEYDTDLFCSSTIQRLVGHYERLLNALVQSPEYPISGIDYLDTSERSVILEHFSGKDRPYVDYGTTSVIDWIESQTPSAIALIVDGTEYSYRDVTALSNQLAHFLIGKGASLVGIKLPRNAWLPIGALSVLKAGMAYVPLDEAYPEERLAYIQSDSACDMILDMAMIERFLQEQALYPTSAPNIQLLPDTLAYVIYTSGSTGNPKGVCITHSNVTAFVGWCQQEFKNDCFDVVYGVTSHCFDLSIFEIFFTWSIGKTLKLLANGLAVPESLASDKNVLLNTVPSLVQNLLATKVDLKSITVLNMAGEEILMSLKQQLDCQKMAVRNLYGPTEDTTYSTFYRLSNEDTYIPIGRPISNSTAYVLDGAMQIVPVGIAGEIYLGGSGLARGYLGKEALTLEKFVENPYETGTRLYRTGDLGAWAPNGQLLFKGRKDYQVKVRGFRIELGEIEKALEKHVSASAVLLKEESLVAYVSGCPNTKELREKLHKSLPGYMVPEHIIDLPSLPLTPNGKIDRQCLKKLPLEIAPRNQSIPHEGIEGQLWNIWSELLGHSQFGVDDNFFDVGGNSLKALKMMHALKVKLAKVCSFSMLMDDPTIRALAQKVTEYTSSSGAVVTNTNQLSSIEKRIWMDCQNPQSSKAYNILSAFEVQFPLNIQKLEKLVRGMVDDYPILRTGFISEKNELVRKVYSSYDSSSYFYHVHSDAEERFMEQESNFLFDLEKGPLFRLTILEQSVGRYFVLFNIHHIIADADTLVLFFTELFSRYLGISETKASQTPIYEIELKDTSREFWKKYLSRIPLSPLNLPYDLEGVKPTFRGSSTAIDLPHRKTSFAMYSLALFITLYKLTGREDIVVGFPVSLRDHAELENQLGCFLNTLPLHFSFKASDTVQTLMDNLKQNILEVLEHKDFSLDTLVEASRPGKMYSVMIDMLHEEHLKVPKVLQELNIIPRKTRAAYTKTDLIFYIHEKAEASQLVIEYSSDRFNEDTVQYIAQTFVDVLHNMMENLGTSIEDVVNIESLEFGALQ